MSGILAAQAIEDTIVLGSIYGVVGVGFVLLYRSTRVLSFTQGAVMVIGALTFADLTSNKDLPLLAALLLVGVGAGLGGMLLYRVVFSRVTASDPFITSVATIGLGGLLQAIVGLTWGSHVRNLSGLVSAHTYRVGAFRVSVSEIVVVVVCLTVIGLLVAVVRLTPMGRRMEAVADNPVLSAHVGINTLRVSSICWGLAAASAAIAGVAYGVYSSVDPGSLPNVALLAFPAVILGGLDSVGGALVGGLLVGLLQSVVTLEINGRWVTVASYVIMLLFLVVRREGLFGKAPVGRI
jgi:branched-chain amino acid transport system permease protein